MAFHLSCTLLAGLLQASYFNGQWQSSAEESRGYDIRGRGQRAAAVHDCQWRTDAAGNEGISLNPHSACLHNFGSCMPCSQSQILLLKITIFVG